MTKNEKALLQTEVDYAKFLGTLLLGIVIGAQIF